MWRNALGGPFRSRGPGATWGRGVGGGGGPGPSPPSPTPERGAPGRAPAGGGVRAGRGRGKRQLRFQRVGPPASSRCRRTGRCEAWKPLLEGRNLSDSVHSLGPRGSRDSGLDLETRLDPATESQFPLTLRGYFVACWPPSDLILFFSWSGGGE